MQVTKPAPAVSEETPGSASLFPSGHLLPFVLVTFLFFLWGIPNNLTDVLIRQFMKSFAISRFQAALVQFAQFMGYFIMAIPAALFMRRFGYKSGFVNRATSASPFAPMARRIIPYQAGSAVNGLRNGTDGSP